MVVVDGTRRNWGDGNFFTLGGMTGSIQHGYQWFQNIVFPGSLPRVECNQKFQGIPDFTPDTSSNLTTTSDEDGGEGREKPEVVAIAASLVWRDSFGMFFVWGCIGL
jgi:hypothetical protein